MRRTQSALRIATWTATVGLLATAVGVAAADVAPTPKTGSASATISLPRLTVTLPDGSTKTVDLGQLVALARSDTGRLASLAFKGGSVAGAALPGWAVDSSNGPRQGSHSVPVSATGVSGSLGLVDYLVSSSGSSVAAQLGALTGTLGVGALGTSASLGDHGVQTVSDPTRSAASVGATIDGLTLTLGDLLPAGVLDGLPLGTLTQLLSRLGVPLPPDVGALLTQLTNISGLLDQVAGKIGDLRGAQSTLDGLIAGVPSLTSAQQAVTAAASLVSSRQAALAAAQSQLGVAATALTPLQSAVVPLQAGVTAAQQQLDAANAAIASLTGQISALQGTIAGLDPLLDALKIATLTTQLNSLQAQLTQAQADKSVATAQLGQAQAALAPVQQQLAAATANAAAAQAAVDAATQALDAAKAQLAQAQQALAALLDQVVNNPALVAARALVTSLTSTVNALLTQISVLVPGLPDLHAVVTTLLGLVKAAPLVDLGHLALGVSSVADGTGGSGTTTCSAGSITVLGKSVATPTCADLTKAFAAISAKLSAVLGVLPSSLVPTVTLDGLTQQSSHDNSRDAKATSAISPLHLAIPSVKLTDVAGGLVGAILSSVQQVQQAAAGLPLDALQPGLLTAHALPVDVGAALGQLTQQLGALPSGNALAGLRTLGLDLSLVGLHADSLYHPSAAIPPAQLPPAQRPPAQQPPAQVPPGSSPAGQPPARGTAQGPAGPGQAAPQSPAAPAARPTGGPASLPFTGMDSTVLVALALVLALAGAHLEILGRRRSAV